MEPGQSIQILAPGDSIGPRLWVVPQTMAANGRPESDSERRRLAQPESFAHPNGAKRITAVRVLVPKRALTPATEQVARYSPVTFAAASDWLLDVTFDNGTKHATKDLRPDLPMVVHY
jgi:hypothetical protein